MPDLKTELQKLGNVCAGVTPAKRSATSTTPHYTRILADRLGPCEASRRVGYAEASLSTALSRGVVAEVAEVAAKGVLAELDAAKEKKLTAMVVVAAKVPGSKLDAFNALTEAMGIPVTVIHEVTQ